MKSSSLLKSHCMTALFSPWTGSHSSVIMFCCLSTCEPFDIGITHLPLTIFIKLFCPSCDCFVMTNNNYNIFMMYSDCRLTQGYTVFKIVLCNMLSLLESLVYTFISTIICAVCMLFTYSGSIPWCSRKHHSAVILLLWLRCMAVVNEMETMFKRDKKAILPSWNNPCFGWLLWEGCSLNTSLNILWLLTTRTDYFAHLSGILLSRMRDFWFGFDGICAFIIVMGIFVLLRVQELVIVVLWKCFCVSILFCHQIKSWFHTWTDSLAIV